MVGCLGWFDTIGAFATAGFVYNICCVTVGQQFERTDHAFSAWPESSSLEAALSSAVAELVWTTTATWSIPFGDFSYFSGLILRRSK